MTLELLPTSYEQEPSYTSREYVELITAVDNAFEEAGGPHRNNLVYVPFTDAQRLEGVKNIRYMGRGKLGNTMMNADIIVCIGRDSEANPDYSDQYPDQNIALASSARSNVDTCVELFELAQSKRNNGVAMVMAGWVNNRYVRTTLALPLIAEAVGVNYEDIYQIPEEQFRQRLQALTPERIAELLEKEPQDDLLAANYRALKSFLQKEDPVEEIMRAYHDSPRVPEARLMLQRAAEAGVPLENLYEENGSVDTISNLLNLAFMLREMEDFHQDTNLQVVLVAGSDHLPRTAWLADHIFPDSVGITCVESDPAISAEEYAASCERERLSFLKGSKWISGTRDLVELERIVEEGYFGANYKDADQIAREVAAQKATGEQK